MEAGGQERLLRWALRLEFTALEAKLALKVLYEMAMTRFAPFGEQVRDVEKGTLKP